MNFQDEMLIIFNDFGIEVDNNINDYFFKNLTEKESERIVEKVKKLIAKYNRVCMNTISVNSITIRDITDL